MYTMKAIMLFFTLIISAVIATPTTHRDNAVSLLEKKDAIASPDPGPAKPGAFRPPDPYEREHAGSKFTAKNFGTQWTPWSEVNKLVIDMTFNVLTNVIAIHGIPYAWQTTYTYPIMEGSKLSVQINRGARPFDDERLEGFLHELSNFILLWEDYGSVPTFDIVYNEDFKHYPNDNCPGSFKVNKDPQAGTVQSF